MPVQINGATSGSTTLVATDAVTTTITLPNITSTLATVSQIQGPAFSAYQSSAQTLSSNTTTKIQFQTKEFDTNSNFDNTTNYRFTPTVAGYYQVNATINWGTTNTRGFIQFYKNGSVYKQGSNIGLCDGQTVSSVVFLNGTTDYIELYGTITVGQALLSGIQYTWFNGSMIRSA